MSMDAIPSSPMATAKSNPSVQTSIRVPTDWLERAEALAEVMSQPGLALTRADAFRLALAEGLRVLEERHHIGSEKSAPKGAK